LFNATTYCVAWNGTYWLCGGVINGNSIGISTDGITWTDQPAPPSGSGYLYSVAYVNGLFIAGTIGFGAMFQSTDGITWTSAGTLSGSSSLIFATAYQDGSYYVPNGNDIYKSSNLSTWTSVYNSPTATLRGIATGPGQIVAAGSLSTIVSSSNPSTTLTISGANTDGFALGDFISNGITTASAASGTITAISGTSVTVTAPSTNWAATQKLYRGQTVVNVTGDTVNLTTFTVPQASLTPSTTYYARVRYATTNTTATTSDFSGWSSFGTAAIFAPAPGTAMAGGYFGGQINDGGTIYNLIVAPAPAGQDTSSGFPYKTSRSSDAPTATFQNEVYGKPANDAGNDSAHPAFQWARALNIGGFSDWYIPAKNELEILYYNLKPTTAANSGVAGCGINPNAVPARASTYPTSGPPAVSPAQTTSTLFQISGAQAFLDNSYYWSSTEFSAPTTIAWYQSFGNGEQSGNFKDYPSAYARAIRRVAA
jgi:hypothetical protein